MGSAVCREADEPSALAEPVVSPLIHGIILHLASALFNCEFSQVLREFFSRESPRREGVFPGLRASLIAEKRLRPPPCVAVHLFLLFRVAPTPLGISIVFLNAWVISGRKHPASFFFSKDAKSIIHVPWVWRQTSLKRQCAVACLCHIRSSAAHNFSVLICRRCPLEHVSVRVI